MTKAKEQNSENIDFAEVKRKSVSGAFSYFLRTIALQGIGLISIIILSTFLSPEEFAIYGIVIVIIGLLTFFSDTGLAAALVQKKSEPTSTDYKTVFTVQQLLSWMIVGICLLLVYFEILERKTGPVGNWLLMSMALSFPLATLKTIPSVMLERELNFSKLVLPQIFEQLAFYSILIILVWKGTGVMAYSYAILARAIVGVMVMMLVKPWMPVVGFNKKAFLDLFGFGFKFQLNDLVARFKDQLFYLFLGYWLPLREFGYIQWSKQWSMYPYNLTVQNIMAITFPTYSRLQDYRDKLGRAINTSLFFITLIIFPILVGMSIFIGPLTTVIPAYAKWQPAVLSFIFFSLSVGWSAVSTPLTSALNAIGEINKTLKLMVMWTILTWILTPLCIIWFGYNGVAFAAFLIGFSSLVAVKYAKRSIPLMVWDSVWRQLVAVLIMGLVGYVGYNVWESSIYGMMMGMVLVSITYFAVFSLIGWNKLNAEVRMLRK